MTYDTCGTPTHPVFLDVVVKLSQIKAKKVSISEVRERLIHYYTHPQDYMDMSRAEISHSSVTVPITPLESVISLDLLGSGCYAKVYALDAKRVLKVIRHEDEAYARYVKLVKAELKNNPHAPKIYYNGKWGNTQVYILERLEDSRQGTDLREVNDLFRAAINKLNPADYRGKSAKLNPYMGAPDPMVLQMAEVLGRSHCLNDLHAGNVMFRGQVPVVTDPAS